MHFSTTENHRMSQNGLPPPSGSPHHGEHVSTSDNSAIVAREAGQRSSDVVHRSPWQTHNDSLTLESDFLPTHDLDYQAFAEYSGGLGSAPHGDHVAPYPGLPFLEDLTTTDQAFSTLGSDNLHHQLLHAQYLATPALQASQHERWQTSQTLNKNEPAASEQQLLDVSPLLLPERQHASMFNISHRDPYVDGSNYLGPFGGLQTRPQHTANQIRNTSEAAGLGSLDLSHPCSPWPSQQLSNQPLVVPSIHGNAYSCFQSLAHQHQPTLALYGFQNAQNSSQNQPDLHQSSYDPATLPTFADRCNASLSREQPSNTPPVKPRRTARAMMESIPCAENGCQRNFRPITKAMKLCRRHQQKYDRNHAGPPTFAFPAGINDYFAAKTKIYPPQVPLCVDGEQLTRDACQGHADIAVRRFVEAASTPYEDGSAYHEFHSRQQKVFNGKGFKDEEVNIRMRFLYQAIVVLHTGGDTVYPEGGDNGGYGKPDKTLKFLDRIEKIVEILKLDKRVCMDVVEGRGVTAFAANPDKFEKRKTQNKDSNERKQQKQKLGDRVQAKRKAKGKNAEESDADSEDWSGDEGDNGEDEDEDREVVNGKAFQSTWQTPQSMAMDYDGSTAPDAPPLFDGPAARTRKRLSTQQTAASDTLPAKKQKRAATVQHGTASSESSPAPASGDQSADGDLHILRFTPVTLTHDNNGGSEDVDYYRDSASHDRSIDGCTTSLCWS